MTPSLDDTDIDDIDDGVRLKNLGRLARDLDDDWWFRRRSPVEITETPPQPLSVPEPSTLVLAGVAAVSYVDC